MGFEQPAGANITQVTTHYGPRSTNQKFGGAPSTKGMVRELVYVFDYNDLPNASSATNSSLEQVIPAYAKVLSAKLEILVGFTSTSALTDLTVGLEKSSDRSVVDADGLITAANATEAIIATRGNYVVGTGALVASNDVGADAVEVVVAPSVDDLLTGKGRLIIEYIAEGPGGA